MLSCKLPPRTSVRSDHNNMTEAGREELLFSIAVCSANTITHFQADRRILGCDEAIRISYDFAQEQPCDRSPTERACVRPSTIKHQRPTRFSLSLCRIQHGSPQYYQILCSVSLQLAIYYSTCRNVGPMGEKSQNNFSLPRSCRSRSKPKKKPPVRLSILGIICPFSEILISLPPLPRTRLANKPRNLPDLLPRHLFPSYRNYGGPD